MFERFDEAELLAWVEGELAPDRAAALERRLAGSDPRGLHILHAMRDERAALRAAPQPELPESSLADLEPLLARPMLIPPPQELRRRYRRRQRRLPSAGLLAAASVAVALGAGTWLAVDRLSRTAPAPPPAAEPPVENAERSSGTTAGGPARSTGPDRLASTGRGAEPPAPALSGSDRRPAAPGKGPVEFAAVEFMLVLEASDAASAEDVLGRALSDLGVGAALVRNLDDAEVRRLAERWHGDRAAAARDPALAGIARSDKEREALMRAFEARLGRGSRPGRAAPSRGDAGGAEPGAPGRQLAGPRELAPGYEQQLAHSDRGAAYTVCLPAAKLAALLSKLAVDEGRAAALCMMPAAEQAPPHPAAEAAPAWLESYARARDAAAALTRERPDALIMLPVAVRSPA